jgi:hypothetical protein
MLTMAWKKWRVQQHYDYRVVLVVSSPLYFCKHPFVFIYMLQFQHTAFKFDKKKLLMENYSPSASRNW